MYGKTEFSIYLEELREEQSAPRRQIAHASGTKTFDRVIVARFIAIFILAGVLLAAIMYGRVELSSLYSRQAQLQAELEQYENENKSLDSENRSYKSRILCGGRAGAAKARQEPDRIYKGQERSSF